MRDIGPLSIGLLATSALTSAIAQTPPPLPPILAVDAQGYNGSNTYTPSNNETYALAQNTLTSGAMIVLCWGAYHTGPNTFNFNTSNILPWLAAQLKSTVAVGSGPSNSDMGLVIGLKGGDCAPAWLGSPSMGVPVRTFMSTPWTPGTPTSDCQPISLFPSWDYTYEQQYVAAVSALWSALGSTTLTTGDGLPIAKHVLAIEDGAMVAKDTDEMGVFSTGCTANGTLSPFIGQTSYQVAETWASLPPPDNYTPAKVQLQYRAIFDHMLGIVGTSTNKWGQQITITQAFDGSDASLWPLIDSNGVPLPPQDTPVAQTPMFQPILQQATQDAKTCYTTGSLTFTSSHETFTVNCTSLTDTATAASLAAFGFPGLFLDTEQPSAQGITLTVSNAGSYGGGVKWQFNNDAKGTVDGDWVPNGNLGTRSITACPGRETGTITLATPSCYGSIVALADCPLSSTGSTTTGLNPTSPFSPNPYLFKWLEALPEDALPLSVNGTVQAPLYGCFSNSGSTTCSTWQPATLSCGD